MDSMVVQWMLSRTDWTNDESWMHSYSSQNGLDHGRERIRPWTSSWLAMGAVYNGLDHGRGPRTSSWMGHGCPFLELDQTMDVIIFAPWLLFSAWLGCGCSLLRTDQTMDVIMLGPWQLSSQKPLNGLEMVRAWTSSCLGRLGPWLLTSHWVLSSQNGLNHRCHHARPRMLSSQNGLDHGRHHGCAMGALAAEQIHYTIFYHGVFSQRTTRHHVWVGCALLRTNGWAIAAPYSGRNKAWTS